MNTLVKNVILSSILLLGISNLYSQNNPVSMNFCTAADAKYFKRLLNLIGSLHHTNFDQTKEIAVFDLGLTNDQKETLNGIQKVKLYSIELTHPDLLTQFVVRKIVPGWYAWKFVVLKQTLDIFPYAGCS